MSGLSALRPIAIGAMALCVAAAGSIDVTSWPSAGPLMRTNVMPRRSATYSISVVLP